MHVGIDFGTSNTSLAIVRDGSVSLATFQLFRESTPSFRSVIYVTEEDQRPVMRAGPAAVEQYLAEKGSGRILQSLKSFLASSLFDGTRIGNVRFTLEELVGYFLRQLRQSAEVQFGDLGRSITLGRPVRFVGEENAEDETRALERLRRSAALAGFDEVRFDHEPLAAAYSYERGLVRDECLLVGDFGGGTTDFCVIQVGPEAKKLGSKERILGTSGVAVAGNIFDGRIVTNRIAPLLGRDESYRSMGGKDLPVPAWIFRKLASWHELSFLKEPKMLSILNELSVMAPKSSGLRNLVHLVRENLGYSLFRSVENVKMELTAAGESQLHMHDLPVPLSARVKARQFEDWIEDDLGKISFALDECLKRAQIGATKVDRVFLTGGSSFVPAVRRIFEKRFRPESISGGNELTSVAMGLALSAHATA